MALVSPSQEWTNDGIRDRTPKRSIGKFFSKLSWRQDIATMCEGERVSQRETPAASFPFSSGFWSNSRHVKYDLPGADGGRAFARSVTYPMTVLSIWRTLSDSGASFEASALVAFTPFLVCALRVQRLVRTAAADRALRRQSISGPPTRLVGRAVLSTAIVRRVEESPSPTSRQTFFLGKLKGTTILARGWTYQFGARADRLIFPT